MLNEEGARNLFNQIMRLWINPEISHRRQAGNTPSNLSQVNRCLIRLPLDRPPIVEFNDEIHWTAKISLRPDASFQKGQSVFTHDVRKIDNVSPPEVNGRRVAFVYLFYDGYAWDVVFDFTPNTPQEISPVDDKGEWASKVIASSLQSMLIQRVVQFPDSQQKELERIGLWAAPALLPYPISMILKQLVDGDSEGAQKTLQSYCNPGFIEELTSKWWGIQQFSSRKQLIEDALSAHKDDKYNLSIYALLPNIEGIITDWVYSKLPESEIPWRPESKTKKFRDIVLSKPQTTFVYKRIVDSAIQFILDGPVLSTFKRWIDQINKAFPNRNIVGHGKYDESLFTEDNSIKLFLLLDTIYYIISV